MSDKKTPARQPDPRLSNLVLEGGKAKDYMGTDRRSLDDAMATGQCAWCLQRERQAFALVCPDHISHWRNSLDELQRDISALCRAVGEFDGARPESPQIVLQICTERANQWRARAMAAENRLGAIASAIATLHTDPAS